MCYKRLLIVLVLLSPFLIFAQSDWELEKDANNIKIYTRKAPQSKLKEFKAQTILNTTLKTVLDELLEAPKYYESCPSNVSHYVKQIKSNQHVFYAYKNLPWPIMDRDLVTLLTVNKEDTDTVKLTLESFPDGIPKKNKTIRIKKLMGYWLLKKVEEGVLVTQQVFVDPEGSIPAGILNSVLVKGPFKTFSRLHNLKS